MTMLTIRAEDVTALYSEESVADYVSESVSVMLPDGTREPGICYNFPQSKLEGTNSFGRWLRLTIGITRRQSHR